MGAVIGGVSEEKQKVIYDFGLKLGLLFQVQDDIIDATLSSDEAGKPTGNDGHKNSFVNLLGVDGANQEKSRLIKELNKETNKLDESLAKTLQKIISDYFKG